MSFPPKHARSHDTPPPDLMPVREVASTLRVSIGRVYELIHEHDLPHYTLGRKTYRVSRAELAGWLRQRKEA